jgi:myo-inositol-1-phosphate synthase
LKKHPISSILKSGPFIHLDDELKNRCFQWGFSTMQNIRPSAHNPLLIVAGAKGAVGSTVAATIGALKKDPHPVLPCLTTAEGFFFLGDPSRMEFTGWDISPRSMKQSLEYHGVLPPDTFLPYEEYISQIEIHQPPPPGVSLSEQVDWLTGDLQKLQGRYPGASPVLVNLLPACAPGELDGGKSLDRLYSHINPVTFPDIAYTLAAICSGIPVVNFTPNAVELPAVIEEGIKAGVPLCGRDGKTGQTYLKVVLASALKARSLRVNGWYSLNILGNEDGKNLADPRKAAGKLANKTEVLEEILGYPVGGRHGSSSHKVAIDYYPPRGDCKEAWDVIDFSGLFGLPMSLRLNLQARDSILAAPLIVDLARWMVSLRAAGRSGLVKELSFYFKKPLGPNPPITFQDQLAELSRLESFCQDQEKIRAGKRGNHEIRV